MSKKSSVSEKWRQGHARRKIEKEQRLYRKYAGVKLAKPPKPMRGPIMMALACFIGMVYYIMTLFLVKGIVTGFVEYCAILTGAVFASCMVMLREGTIASADRTLKIKIGDAPGIVADGHIPGGNVHSLRFIGTDDAGQPVDGTRHFELGWGGPLKRWPFKGRGPAVVMLCQYNVDDNGHSQEGRTPQAGFMMGDEYVVPLKPEAYRFDMLEASRDYRYAKLLRSAEEFGGRIHPRTWVVLATNPISLPTGQIIKGPVVADMELWHEKRLRKRVTSTLHDHGIDEKITGSMGM